MNKTEKILIVTALIVVIGIVIAVRQQGKESASVPPVATSLNTATSTENAVDNLKSSSEKNLLPKLVDLGADKCIPCKMMMPILEEIKDEYKGKLDVEFIDVWKNPAEGQKYGIRIIPTQIFYNASGKELFRHTGFFSKADILAKWKEFGIDLQDKEK